MGILIVHDEAVVPQKAVICIDIVEDYLISGVVYQGLLLQLGPGTAQGDSCVCDRNIPCARGGNTAA